MLSRESSLITQAISSQIEDIASGLQEIYNPSSAKYTIARLIEILNNDPTLYACLQLKAARLVELIGIYTNPDKDKEKFINRNFANMEGSITEVYLQSASAIPFGFSCQEILFQVSKTYKKKEWTLKGFNLLNPEENTLTFHVEDNKPTHLYVQESERKVKIPMWKILHLTNGLLTSFGKRKLFGFPELFRVAPFVKLKEFIYQQMAVASKTRATGLLIGKSHTNVRVNEFILDASGKPIKSGRTVTSAQNLFNNLLNIRNFGCMVIPKGDEVFPLNLPTGERFWSLALQLCKEEIYRGLMVPSLLMERSVASYTLSDTQLTIFDANLKSIVNQIQDQLLEKIIKPLIIWNYGVQETYGSFKPKEENSAIFKQARAQNIYAALGNGIVTPDDPEVISAIRSTLDFKQLTEEEIAFKLQMQQQLEQLRLEEAQEMEQQEKQPDPSQQK